MSNPWALWRRRLIDNAQLAVAMQAKLAKGIAFMRHRSTRLLGSAANNPERKTRLQREIEAVTPGAHIGPDNPPLTAAYNVVTR